MEAYLDWQSKSAGIKLNDVIEENRYVANGKTVKKGDFLTYVGDDVAPAIEPPFNAIALSSGEGAPEYVEEEVAKTGNIFPTSGWNEEVAYTKYSTNDGYVLEVSTSATQSSDFPAYQACDGTISTFWRSGNLASSWIKIKFPVSTKITKMKTYINEYSSGTFTQALIQGSNDDSVWTTLANIAEIQNELTEVILNDKADYYQFYRIKCNLSSSSQVNVFEWQTSEYIVKEQIPSTEHNEQVKIARLPIEIKKTGNIFPTSWTEETIYKYNSDDGYVLEADNVSSSYPLNNACDGDESTYFRTDAGQTSYTVKMKCPKPTKITKMKTRIYNSTTGSFSAKIYGTKDVITTYTGDETWVLLHTISEAQSSLTEITLDNTDYYLNYRIVIEVSTSSTYTFVYEWQTSEYIEKEVIQ